MSKNGRKVAILLIVFVLVMSVLGSAFSIIFSASEFDGREAEWNKICSVYATYKENKAKCDEYKVYLTEKKNQTSDMLDGLKGNIDGITGDIAKDNETLKTVEDRIADLTREINSTIARISETETQIVTLEQEIADRIIKIDLKKAQVESYMINLQSTSRVNGYIEFIMGAKDFAEISRRVEGVNRINEYTRELIEALNQEKALLEENKQDLDFQRENLVTLQSEQEESKITQVALRQEVERRLASLEDRHAELIAMKEAAEDEQRLVNDRIDSIGKYEPDPSYGGLAWPVSSGFYVSATVWYYTGPLAGRKHLGLDLAAPAGTPIVAPANGLVIASQSHCPSWGGYPNQNCNNSYGNYVLMIINNNGTIYGVLYGHMLQNGVLVSNGQAVTKGQQVGKMGSSGSSTGYHVHAEIFYLGNDSVEAAYNRWYNSGANITFGTSYSSGPEVQYRCDVNGYQSPCRLDPGAMWGLGLGEWH